MHAEIWKFLLLISAALCTLFLFEKISSDSTGVLPVFAVVALQQNKSFLL